MNKLWTGDKVSRSLHPKTKAVKNSLFCQCMDVIGLKLHLKIHKKYIFKIHKKSKVLCAVFFKSIKLFGKLCILLSRITKKT